MNEDKSQNPQEPVFAIILKIISVVEVVMAVFLLGSDNMPWPSVICASSAIVVWWMGELIALLSKIARQSEEKTHPSRSVGIPSAAKAADGDVPIYTL